jgi:hypothetical protein
MPITTYISESERNYWTTRLDTELLELLTELCETTGKQWALQPHTRLEGHWWHMRTTVVYTLYKPLYFVDAFQAHEWQVINFYQEHSGTTINTLVPKDTIVNFIYGYIGGYADGQKP